MLGGLVGALCTWIGALTMDGLLHHHFLNMPKTSVAVIDTCFNVGIALCFGLAFLSFMQLDCMDQIQENLSDWQTVPNDKTPSSGILRQWQQMPGGAEALQQIEASGVPMLMQDFQALKKAWCDHRQHQETRLRWEWERVRRAQLDQELA
jgi:hypothetical protein